MEKLNSQIVIYKDKNGNIKIDGAWHTPKEICDNPMLLTKLGYLAVQKDFQLVLTGNMMLGSDGKPRVQAQLSFDDSIKQGKFGFNANINTSDGNIKFI